MAYFNNKTGKIIHIKDKPVEDYPGWIQKDCGCCSGIKWGGEYPRECTDCQGNGFYVEHIKTGLRKIWPGGTFIS